MAKHCYVAEIRAINLQSFSFRKRKKNKEEKKKKKSLSWLCSIIWPFAFVRSYILLFYLVSFFIFIFLFSFHYYSSSYVYRIMFYLLLILLLLLLFLHFNLFLENFSKLFQQDFFISRKNNSFSQYYRNIIFICSFLFLYIIFLLF